MATVDVIERRKERHRHSVVCATVVEIEVADVNARIPPEHARLGRKSLWVSELADGDPNHTLHVVRGLEPAGALETLGAKPRLFQSCALPEKKPDEWTSLPGAALGVDPGTAGTLVAGTIGAWTFVYDDSGFTSYDRTPLLSADGRSAATCVYSSDTNASLAYAVNGEELFWSNVCDLDLEADLPGVPADLRAAFDAAGIFELADIEPGEHDHAIGMRVVCALAGLACTLDDLRRIPLLITRIS